MKNMIGFFKYIFTVKNMIVFVVLLLIMNLFDGFSFFLYEKGIKFPSLSVDPMLGFLLLGFLIGINTCRIYYDYKNKQK